MDSSGRRRTAVALAVVVAVALAVRFFGLGERVFHWDEARVGYWILQYGATGDWEYRAIVHGPFLFHVNELLFGVLGDSNAVARAPVALVGGLLPAVAWLFRSRLDDAEVVALAGLLALNPVLVYYSRFMRNDVLVAAFSLAALGFAVRAIDTGRGRNLVAAGALLALAFTAKENALVYVGMFVGATALLFDARLFTARERGESWRSTARDYGTWTARGLWDWRRSLAGATAAFLLVFAAFYAPRPALYQAFSDPSQLPGALAAGTLGAAGEFWGTWGVGGVSRDHSYVAFLEDAVETMVSTALVVSVAGVLGFLAERYVADEPRDLVLFAGYWAFASVVVYPAVTDISGVWSVTHAVVPLTIPAAVGIGMVVHAGRRSLESDDKAGVALAALVVLALVAQVGVVTAETSFVMPQEEENDLVQFGQPGSDMSDALATVESVTSAREAPGPDVVFFGEHFHVTRDIDPSDPASVAGTNWFNRLPLNWYLERGDAAVASTQTESAITECTTDVTSRDPSLCDAPVVVTRAEHYADLAPTLTERGYESRTYELTSTNTVIVVFVDTDAPGYEPF